MVQSSPPRAKPLESATHQAEQIKDQLIWSQKEELKAMRREFNLQKQALAVQQQRIVELEGQVLQLLMAANRRVLFSEDPNTPPLVPDKYTDAEDDEGEEEV